MSANPRSKNKARGNRFPESSHETTPIQLRSGIFQIDTTWHIRNGGLASVELDDKPLALFARKVPGVSCFRKINR
jgi:hypothetical protein